jgi:hypothetical protein
MRAANARDSVCQATREFLLTTLIKLANMDIFRDLKSVKRLPGSYHDERTDPLSMFRVTRALLFDCLTGEWSRLSFFPPFLEETITDFHFSMPVPSIINSASYSHRFCFLCFHIPAPRREPFLNESIAPLSLFTESWF